MNGKKIGDKALVVKVGFLLLTIFFIKIGCRLMPKPRKSWMSTSLSEAKRTAMRSSPREMK